MSTNLRDVVTLGDETLTREFEAAFCAQMKSNGIQITNTTTKLIEWTPLTFQVRICGFAGDVSFDEFWNPATKAPRRGAEKVVIDIDPKFSKGIFAFQGCDDLGGNEFYARYVRIS